MWRQVSEYQIKTLQINSAHSVTLSKGKHESTTMKSHTSKPEKDYQKNIRSPKKVYRKEQKDVKKLNDAKKREYQKSAHVMKLKSKCITITSEENIVTDKLKDTNYKIKDRQYQILKLQKQIDTHEKKNSLEKN